MRGRKTDSDDPQLVRVKPARESNTADMFRLKHNNPGPGTGLNYRVTSKNRPKNSNSVQSLQFLLINLCRKLISLVPVSSYFEQMLIALGEYTQLLFLKFCSTIWLNCQLKGLYKDKKAMLINVVAFTQSDHYSVSYWTSNEANQLWKYVLVCCNVKGTKNDLQSIIYL